MVDAIRSASDNDGMPHGSGVSKPTEQKAIRLADKRLRLIEARTEAVAKRQEVYDLIDGVDGVEGDLLFERYIKLRKWEEICVLLHYSWQGVHKVHRRALAIVEGRLKCTIGM
jgi:phosphatidylserine/phosphatidylglycerophosphate/cardiolipin synthase-like enzyme